MPLISRIGTRSPKVRLLYAMIYAALSLGAVTMIYPLLLMLGGAVKSEADYRDASPLPNYLWNDDVLWAKYVQSKYDAMTLVAAALHRDLIDWDGLTPPAKNDVELAQQFRAFRDEVPWPQEWYTLGHASTGKVVASNGRAYRAAMRQRFGTVEAMSDALHVRIQSWSELSVPAVEYLQRRFLFPHTPDYEVYHALAAKAPRADWIVADPDAAFLSLYLKAKWATIEAYNKAHDTHATSYDQILLATTPPESGPQRDDWETFVRRELNVAYIRVDNAALPALRAFLKKRYFDRIADLNRLWGVTFDSFDQLKLPQPITSSERAQSDLSAFLKDDQACPLSALRIDGPRQAFEAYLAKTRGVTPEKIAPAPLPIETVDWLDFQTQKTSLRWEFLTRNFSMVLSYILFQGNGVRNTLLYCTLAIVTNLLVNPLAAYALSRYKPPTAYTILLFCMCTMAFPAEVTMIPSFLLLKKFPLVSIFVGIAAAALATWLIHKARPRGSVLLKGTIGVGIGIAAGWWLTPLLAQKFLGRPDGSISLLNTFWALVLPGMANGFSIFLLKGFFDSLPRELYEAADIDGASEWTKFWMITMSLSQPILAVLALGAFTAAYGEFIMALVIIPDQKMWTMMVWLYQMQSSSHQTVTYASLVLAAIPTMLMFILCQNVIMRGLVVPTEK